VGCHGEWLTTPNSFYSCPNYVELAYSIIRKQQSIGLQFCNAHFDSLQGFIKAMSILKEDYGKVFINFGEPMSVSQALAGRVDRSIHSFGPIVLQDLTAAESRQVVSLAHEIVNRQRQLTVSLDFDGIFQLFEFVRRIILFSIKI